MNKVLNAANETMTKYRWTVCTLLFFATTINYMDRQVLSLLQPRLEEIFHWTDSDYGTITGLFALAYAISMIFVGRFIDKVGTKKGYAWAIGIWSVGACIHALCGLITEKWTGLEDTAAIANAPDALIPTVVVVSMTAFILGRIVLAIGEAGNFPAAIKATAEYFPKKDRAFATGIFNSGSNVGAILAPLSVPFMAKAWGWEAAFLVVGGLGFIWLFFWLLLYKKPEQNKWMNDAERAYINQDAEEEGEKETVTEGAEAKVSFWKMLQYKQTWGLFLGKFMTDGVWWFYLFWTPAYLKAEYGMIDGQIALPIGILYTITVFGSIFGGKFPNYFFKKGMNPYEGRMKAMMYIAIVPLVVVLAQPLGHIGALGGNAYWIPIILIGIGGSAHQAWSANFFTTGSDLFPKKAVATITGITGLAGGLSSFILNKGSGMLFDYSLAEWGSKTPGYTIVFTYCAVAYIIGWLCMKSFSPKYNPIKDL